MKYLFIILISFIFISCASKTNQKSFHNKKTNYQSKSHTNLSRSLNNFYNEYKGVNYKYGGSNKKGLDCSAFVQKAYKQALNIQIPRTTYYQAKIGKYISKNSLKMGDLVFFRPSAKYRHVGIYLENGTFMHVSTSRGVKISYLNNVYWKKHYWKSKRLLK
ncbi:MAG: C40 family peptidase [Campylobacteraceae bacterium]|nr:C40 family peptidase [Campylobacteraceae bacterium]